MSPLAPVVCTAVVGIAVLISQRHSAYLARQLQIRIERHRLDPNFPLEAPPGKIRLFLRKHGVVVFATIANLCNLIFLLTRPWPLDRWDVLSIATAVTITAWVFSSDERSRARREDLETIGRMLDVDRSLADQVLKLNAQAAQLTGIVESIAERIGDGEK